MSPIDRVDQIAASQRRLDNYLTDLAKAVGSSMGEAGAMERARLEGRLGSMTTTLGALSGAPQPGLTTNAVAGSMGNTNPTTGQGNQLIESGLDTVRPLTLSGSEQGISFDLYGKYAGGSPTIYVTSLPTGGGGSTMATSMCAVELASSSACDTTASIYTRSAILITANSPTLPYIVGYARLFRFASPNNATNVTAWTATLELVKNLPGSEAVVGTRTVDLLALIAPGDIALVASAAGPFTPADTYDIRVKIRLVSSGSASTDLKVGMGELGAEFAYTPDASAYVLDRTPGQGEVGDGSDGTVTIASGTTTLSRDMLYENLTIAAGAALEPNGYRIFVRNKGLNLGTIRNNGSDGAVYAGGAPGPAGSLGGGTYGGRGGDGGANHNGASGVSASNSLGGSGGAGGYSWGGLHIGGSGGTASPPANQQGTYRLPSYARLGLELDATRLQGGCGGGGGGGGIDGADTGIGGGGGGGGGVIVIHARYFDNSGGAIYAIGGAGATLPQGYEGGGGGGGGGGVILIVANTYIRGYESVAGGSYGTSPGGGYGSVAGSAGTVLYLRG